MRRESLCVMAILRHPRRIEDIDALLTQSTTRSSFKPRRPRFGNHSIFG